MSSSRFELACDRLSRAVDEKLYQRLHWERTDAPVLARMVELIQAVIADRPEFELNEEGATNELKRYVLKVHGHRIMAISMWLAAGEVQATAEQIERSRFQVEDSAPVTTASDALDEAWMTATLEELIGRVRI